MLTTVVKLSKNRFVEQETGYLICENATLGSTGMQEYLASELNIEGVPPMTKVRVYRPEEEVFKPESLASLENKAFTMFHPDENVTSLNDSELRKGTVYNVRREGNTIVGDIQVTDQDTINKMKYVKCLSLGYDLDLESMEGEPNAYIARNIRYNHVALVPKGRSKVAQINDASGDKIDKGEEYMSLFKKSVAVVDEDKLEKDEELDQKVEDCKDESPAELKDECKDECEAKDCNDTENSAKDEETESEEEKVEKRDEDEGAEEDTVTKEIEKRVAKGDYTKEDLEKLLEKLDKGETKEIEHDYEERKDEEKNAKDGGIMTLSEIDAIQDSEVRKTALEEYKANLMAQKGLAYGDDANAFTKSVEKTENTAKDAELERRNYYKHTLNPHENPDYQKECVRLSNVIDF